MSRRDGRLLLHDVQTSNLIGGSSTSTGQIWVFGTFPRKQRKYISLYHLVAWFQSCLKKALVETCDFFLVWETLKGVCFFLGPPQKKNNVGQRSPWGHLWKFIKTLHRGLLWDLAWKGPSESWPWIQGFSPFFPVSVMDPNPRNDGRSVVDLKMLTMRNSAKMFLFFKQSWKWKMAIYTCISLSLYIYER